MSPDRTDSEPDPDRDRDAASTAGTEDVRDRDRAEDGGNDEDAGGSSADSLRIPKMETEDAGSGLLADLKADNGVNPIDIPDVAREVTEPPETSSEFEDVDLSEVDNELLKTFVALVLVINAAVLAVSLGLLFLIFEGAVDRALALLVGGAVLFGFAVRRYRRYRASADQSETGVDADDDGVESDSDSDSNSNSDLDLDADPDAEADANTDGRPEPESQSKSESGAGSDSESDGDDNSDSPSETAEN